MKKKLKLCLLAYSIKDVDLYISLIMNSKIDEHVLCCRLSSYLYAKYKGLNAKALFHIPITSSIFKVFGVKAISSDADVRFYEKQKISKKYLDYTMSLYIRSIKNNKSVEFDSIFLTGNARIAEQAAQAIFNKDRIIFWEAGPSGKVYFSKKGVNADAEFKDKPLSEFILAKQFKETCVPLKEHVENTPFVIIFFIKVIELGYILLLNFLRNREFNEFLPKLRLQPQKKQTLISQYPSQFLYFLDQVEVDVNSTHHGASAEEIIATMQVLYDFFKSKYPNLKIIRRSHPRQKHTLISNKLSDNFGKNFISHFDGELLTDINKALLVTTVNSTTGLETLLNGKRIFLFGNSYYENLYGVHKKQDIKEFETIDFNDKNQSSVIADEANFFLEKNFIPIDYRNNSFNYFSGFDKFICNIMRFKNKHNRI